MMRINRQLAIGKRKDSRLKKQDNSVVEPAETTIQEVGSLVAELKPLRSKPLFVEANV